MNCARRSRDHRSGGIVEPAETGRARPNQRADDRGSAEALLALINSVLISRRSRPENSSCKARRSTWGRWSKVPPTWLPSWRAPKASRFIHTSIRRYRRCAAMPTVAADHLELARNAVKFTDRGYVVARALPLQTFEHDVVLRFDVQDSGIASLPASRSASSSRSFKLTVRRRSIRRNGTGAFDLQEPR